MTGAAMGHAYSPTVESAAERALRRIREERPSTPPSTRQGWQAEALRVHVIVREAMRA